jgi:hypothetical protein
LRAAFKDPDAQETLVRIDATGSAEQTLEHALLAIRQASEMHAGDATRGDA